MVWVFFFSAYPSYSCSVEAWLSEDIQKRSPFLTPFTLSFGLLLYTIIAMLPTLVHALSPRIGSGSKLSLDQTWRQSEAKQALKESGLGGKLSPELQIQPTFQLVILRKKFPSFPLFAFSEKQILAADSPQFLVFCPINPCFVRTLS